MGPGLLIGHIDIGSLDMKLNACSIPGIRIDPLVNILHTSLFNLRAVVRRILIESPHILFFSDSDLQ